MAFQFPLDKKLVSPPGSTIQETIDALGMSRAAFAVRMGIRKDKVTALLKGKTLLTVELAIELERVLGIPVNFWLKRENAYRETLARIEEQEDLEQAQKQGTNLLLPI